jgi:uncharacterized protein (UPF0332 family)
MSVNEIRSLVQYRLEQAEQAMRVGKMALDDPINRFCYAMFCGVLALLAARKMEMSKHQGAVALFDKEFVRAGIFSKDLSTWLHGAFEQRMELDYKAPVRLTAPEVQTLFYHAEDSMRDVRDHLGRVLDELTAHHESS